MALPTGHLKPLIHFLVVVHFLFSWAHRVPGFFAKG